jgi:hypothetical protein
MKILGLPLLIEWDKFEPGTSFFVPCLDRKLTQRFVETEAKRLKVEVICKQVVERGKYGLRVWRVEDIMPSHSSSPSHFSERN